MASRPLSPHLTVYRFAYTMALSILHRVTGVALSVGLVVLVLWLLAMAGGAQSHAGFARFAGSWLFRVLLGLWLVAFVYHFSNGIRHLFWDAGKGLERAQARRSAWFVVGSVAVVSLLLLFALFGKGTA
jgi:succinate dehydrogenase / fumarate reductase, cytochrome b subunit